MSTQYLQHPPLSKPSRIAYGTFLGVYALIHLGLGLKALIQPELFSQALEFELASISAVNEVRAYYGGVFTVLGVVLGYYAVIHPPCLGILTILGLWALGAVMGRIISTLLDGVPNDFMVQIWTVEWLMLLGSWGFYRLVKRRIPP